MSSNTAFAALPTQEKERLLTKLAKLKALAECKTGNVNETATAAATMTRLMLEYQIEQADLQPQARIEEVQDELLNGEVSRRGFASWQTSLLVALARANDCISYTASERSYGLWGVESEHCLRLIGTHDDIEHVRTLFTFCLQEIERLCYRWAPRAPVARKNDFRMGAAAGIGEKVRQEREAVLAEERARAQVKGETSRALVVFDRKQDQVNRKAREIGLSFASRQGRSMSKNAYEAGYQAGASLDLAGKPRQSLMAG